MLNLKINDEVPIKICQVLLILIVQLFGIHLYGHKQCTQSLLWRNNILIKLATIL